MTLPLYRSVHDELRRRIVSGTYPAGAGLPSERKLIVEFGVSLITVRRAMDELVLDGLIERRQGVGSFVRHRARAVSVGMSSFTSDVRDGRLRLARTLLADTMVPAPPEVAGKLAVQAGSRVRLLMRLDSEGGAPLSVDEAFVCPALATAITAEIAGSPSFLHLWEERSGIVLSRAEYEVSVQSAGKTDQEVLQIGPDSPLLVTGELVFGEDGRPVVWVVTRYRSDRTRLCGSFSLGREDRVTRN